MFVRWFFTVFPREMAQAWHLMRPALVVWLALSATLALLTSYTTTVTTGGADLVLVRAAFSRLVIVATAWVLDRSTAGRPLEPAELFGLYLRKVPALLGYGAIAFGLCLAARALTLAAVVMVLGGGDGGLLAGRALSLAVYYTLLVRFCFFPFLVVLAERGKFDALTAPAEGLARRAAYLAWPLFVSDRLGEGRRWGLLPYVVLISLAPAWAGSAGTAALAAGEWLAFMAYAVLFAHYKARSSEVGA